jgi:hypothetical protein
MFIARDGKKDGKNDGDVGLFVNEPCLDSASHEWYLSNNNYGLQHKALRRGMFPEVLNGTCFELILGEEV